MNRIKILIILSFLFAILIPAQAEEPKDGILDYGKGERYSMLLQFQKDDQYTSTLNIRMSTKLSGDQMAAMEMQNLNMDITMSYKYDVKVLSVDKTKNNNATLEYTMKDFTFSLPGQNMDMPNGVSQKAIEEIKGEKFTCTMDQIGKQSIVDVSPKLNHSFKQMKVDINKILDDIYPDIPEEPIGKGGKWQINKKTIQEGNTLQVIAVYTLKDINTLENGQKEMTLELKGSFMIKDNPQFKNAKGIIKGTIYYVPETARVNLSKGITIMNLDTGNLNMKQEISIHHRID